MSNVITGARGNLEGYGKIKICPACLDITDEQFVLTLPHILQECEAISGLRDALGLTEFFDTCKSRSKGKKASYHLYLCGFAPDESCIAMEEYRKRGDNLEKMRVEWLSVWT